MKYAIKLLTILTAGMLFAAGVPGADSTPPPEGGVLPDFILAVPQDSRLQQYLGVIGKKTFAVPEIKAEIVIIEIFNMY